MAKKSALGDNLSSIFDDDGLFGSEEASAPQKLKITEIEPNKKQPRKTFNDEALQALADSIVENGIIQPLTVRPYGDVYQIVAGERRWRAAKIAGLREVPVRIMELTDEQTMQIALIENLQREDLNPIETATAIKQLMDECDYTHEKVAERIGKSRTLVTNTLGLLTLPPRVIELIAAGRLSAGHAKVLIALDDPEAQTALALKGADGKLSVRKFEELVKAYRNPKKKVVVEQSIELKDLVARMQRAFATKVSVLGNDKKGRIYIDYYNRDDLDRITDILESIESRE